MPKSPPVRRDPLFHHRCSPTTGARSKDSDGNCATPTAPDAAASHGYCSRDLSIARAEVALVKLPSAAMVFDEEKSLERCPAAVPQPGVMFASFMNASMCCNGSPLRPSLTHLDGTAVAPRLHRRPCWSSCDRAGERKVDVLDSQRNSGAFAVVSSQFSGLSGDRRRRSSFGPPKD